MFVISNPVLIQLIEDNRRKHETPEACLKRLVTQALVLRGVIDKVDNEIEIKWPTP